MAALRSMVRMWPWTAALVAAAVVNLLIGGLRGFDYHGINGFSTTNYGWMAFALVGGVVFAWRLAHWRMSRLGLLRPVLAAGAAYVWSFVLVTISGVLFLPQQPISVTMATDAAGRSLPVGLLVLAAAVVMMVLRWAGRALRRGAPPETQEK